jgi:HK97 family phage portal protein
VPPYPISSYQLPQPASRRGVSGPNWEQWDSIFNPAESMFAPGNPLMPVEQEPVRSFDFPVGVNQVIRPRFPEIFSFAELKAFANVELCRLAIETRKDQIERLDWQIRPREKLDNAGRKKPPRKDYIERIKAAERFFRKPNQWEDFHTWMRVIIEDLLVLDAPAFEKQRTRGGDLAALQHIPGDTVKVLVDHNGRLPPPPAPAYQQIIKGRVWANLTADDIVYAPRNPRPGKLYGFGPVEQCIVTINTVMRRQASQLAYFSDGTVPAGMATVPDGWTVDQTKEWQEWMDSVFSGNLAERRKLLWAPAGAKYQAFKEAPIKDDFDEWLARIICYCFSLPPTPFIRQMNRSTAQSDTERALEEGLAPLLVWSKRVADKILWEDLGFRDLEFAWGESKEVDVKDRAEINNTYLRAGVLTINEVRDTMGLEPTPDGDTPLIYTNQGAMTIEMVLNQPDPIELAVAGKAPPAKSDAKSSTSKIEDDRVREIAEIAGGIEALRIPLLRAMQRCHTTPV